VVKAGTNLLIHEVLTHRHGFSLADVFWWHHISQIFQSPNSSCNWNGGWDLILIMHRLLLLDPLLTLDWIVILLCSPRPPFPAMVLGHCVHMEGRQEGQEEVENELLSLVSVTFISESHASHCAYSGLL
jgi:hypothetical protein